jgi:minor extracellular serine protease Vpr
LAYRQQIEAKQQSLKSDLAARHIRVMGSVSTVLNAIFVIAPSGRLAELKSLPGVKGVVAGRRYHLNLSKATQLVNGPAAWSASGGIGNAGAGMKIAMIDTGIDQTHPAFEDNSLTVPAGFPICSTVNIAGSEVPLTDCASFTNNKVIVARSYVAFDAAGDPDDPASDSTPDDYTPRDRVGHGTGTASAAAGVSNTGPALAASGSSLTFNGMAPKAFLGNYKVFGSPEVNDFASEPAIIMAIEDALNDSMDVASLSLGGPAITGPLDTGTLCGNPTGVACDPLAMAAENAVLAGMVVVVAAGNDGAGTSSVNAPTLNSIESPGDAPLAITVGSTTNSHYIVAEVSVLGSAAPADLQQIQGQLGNGPAPAGPIAAPLVDVTKLGDNGLACSALPAGSLNGSFALIERGTCTFLVKVINAQTAGARGVVFYMADQSALVVPGGLGSTEIPAIMISNNDGVSVKSFIDANPGTSAQITPASEVLKPSNVVNLLSYYSSLGPTTGDNAIKPDLAATGGSENFFTDIYLAAQDYDPLGELYSASRYTAGSGTSFATPLVSGSAALVKQAHPGFSPAQIKSALANTSSQVVTTDEQGHNVGVLQLGAGLLDAAAALPPAITAAPASISFGLAGTLPMTQPFQLTNSSSNSATLSLVVTPATTVSGASVTVDQQSLNLAAGATASVNATLSGSLPVGGSYSGFVTVQGGGSTLHIPYLFLVASGTPGNLIVISGPGDTTAGQDAGPIIVKLIDTVGLPVAGAAVTFTAPPGASLASVKSTTNIYGIASAETFLGPDLGNYDFKVAAAGMDFTLTAVGLPQPTIASGSIVNAASFQTNAIAPGSYISIFGTNLSSATASETALILPLAIDNVTVSFDVPSASISVPGYLVYVSPGQVNLQVPWELEGQSSAQVKVTLGDGAGISFGNVVTVPLANYTPAFFEISGGNVAALDGNSKVIGAANPAQSGQTIELFANGLGPVSNTPASGDPAPSSPLAMCTTAATVTIGTEQASPSFCGLAPGFPGLYQLNVAVPSGLASGTYPVTVTIGGQTSPAANLVVQ